LADFDYIVVGSGARGDLLAAIVSAVYMISEKARDVILEDAL
jgi:hypothetical protein